AEPRVPISGTKKERIMNHRTAHRCLHSFQVLSGGLLLGILLAGDGLALDARLSSQAAAKPHEGPVAIDSAVTILVGPAEPGPVAHAAQDLQADFEKVFGKRPAIVHRSGDAAPVTILIGERSNLPEAMRPAELTEPESFCISVTNADWNTRPQTKVVLLACADMRGTIYAIYQFSEEYLGVDPLYYWTDHRPVRRCFGPWACAASPTSLMPQWIRAFRATTRRSANSSARRSRTKCRSSVPSTPTPRSSPASGWKGQDSCIKANSPFPPK